LEPKEPKFGNQCGLSQFDAIRASDIWRGRLERLDEIEGDSRPNLGTLKEAAQVALQKGSTADEASMKSRRELEKAMQSSQFRRTLVDVEFGGRIRKAWTYFYNQSVAGFHEVPQNDWREHQGRWDSTFLRILSDLSKRHGGFEQFREKMSSDWKTSVADHANSLEEVVSLLKSGALDERDLIMWCKPE